MKNNRKGFTLVELVIVIAVIAILAGVVIGTFATVIKKANDSAKLQEIKAAEIAQKADDIMAKIENSNWYGWEDFEASIVDKITTVISNAQPEDGKVEVELNSEAIEKAVSQAMAKYYAENAMANTGLTEAQVKAIVENAFGTFKYEGVSPEQVSAIVNNAITKIPTSLKVTQVQRIVDAAVSRVEAGQLSSAQITTIVTNALVSCKQGLATEDTVEAAVETIVKAIGTVKESQLTSEQVERIIAAAVGAAGKTSWVDSQSYEQEPVFTLTDEEDVKGLATLVNGGYDFADRKIVLPEEVDLSNAGDWTPIGNSYDTQFEGVLVGAEDGTTITGLTLTEQFNAVRNGILIDCSSTGNMDKVGVGFVAYLGEGAILKNITFKDVNINIADDKMDGISVGVAVGYLDGGVIENVVVDGGTIRSVYRVGGLCGAIGYGTIRNCEVKNVTIESAGKDGKLFGKTSSSSPYAWITYADWNKVTSNSYNWAGVWCGYARQFSASKTGDVATKTLTLINSSYSNVIVTSVATECVTDYGHNSNVTVVVDPV